MRTIATYWWTHTMVTSWLALRGLSTLYSSKATAWSSASTSPDFTDWMLLWYIILWAILIFNKVCSILKEHGNENWYAVSSNSKGNRPGSLECKEVEWKIMYVTLAPCPSWELSPGWQGHLDLSDWHEWPEDKCGDNLLLTNRNGDPDTKWVLCYWYLTQKWLNGNTALVLKETVMTSSNIVKEPQLHM